jgi:hypothetical protein
MPYESSSSGRADYTGAVISNTLLFLLIAVPIGLDAHIALRLRRTTSSDEAHAGLQQPGVVIGQRVGQPIEVNGV